MASFVARPKQHGVTEPRSLAHPTEAELVSTQRLVEVLAQSYPQKSKEERSKQKAALNKLKEIVKDWVRELPIEGAKEANPKLFFFGSYRLQVDEPGSIVDTLCVGPRMVNRERDFFGVLHWKLEKMSEVIGMECVLDAHIPFLSFKLDGVSIKLVYASLPYDTIPEDLDICDDYVIQNIHDVTFRTLSECRVTESILNLVPNLQNFRTTLRCVKYWAKARGIWSNVSGFLGESEWSILVARVCQAYPNAAPTTIVSHFFDIFATWCWPNPVMLCPIEHGRVAVWDPMNNENDRNHFMPIISPAYPHGNLKSDATRSTLRVMKLHFSFGDKKCKAIDQKIPKWEDLFEPFKFFEQHMRYLHVDISADSEEDLMTFKRGIEPELRLLISKIEQDGELICHPCPVEYTSRDSCAFFIGLSTDKYTMGILYAKRVPDATLLMLDSWFNEWELRKPNMNLQYDQVTKGMIGSHRWGKHLWPVVGGMPADVP